MRRVVVEDIELLALKRRACPLCSILIIWLGRSGHVRHVCAVLHQLTPTTVLPYEAHGGGEDGLPPLPRLYRPCGKASPFTNVFDMVDYGYVVIAGEDKVAVHAVDGEVGRDRLLRRGEALCNRATSIDASSSRRVP